MALIASFTNRFEKDIKRAQKRHKDLSKLKVIIDTLINELPLSKKYKDHILIGNYVGARECHIEPDWLLIYVIDEKNITFTRTGTHSDLFK
jgi:mRNA interferase YafQ